MASIWARASRRFSGSTKPGGVLPSAIALTQPCFAMAFQ
jgi:hypothetical protein